MDLETLKNKWNYSYLTANNGPKLNTPFFCTFRRYVCWKQNCQKSSLLNSLVYSLRHIFIVKPPTPTPASVDPWDCTVLLEAHCSRSREVVRVVLVGALDVSVSDGTLEPGVRGRRW